MTKCLICENSLTIKRLTCEACKTDFEGIFYFPRLARLSPSEQKLTEILIEYGGNLKEMAEFMDISYPTLKKRLYNLAQSLKKIKFEDKRKIDNILKAMENHTMSVEEGMKLIKEINHEL